MLSKFFIEPCPGGASEAHGLVQEVRSLLDPDGLARPLSERLDTLEYELTRRQATLLRAESLAGATPRSILTALRDGRRDHALAIPGSSAGAAAAPADLLGGLEPLVLSNDALEAALNTECFLAIHRALSALDINNAASRIDCLGRCFQPNCILMARQLLGMDRLLARRHPALEAGLMLATHLAEYLEYAVTVDFASGQVPPRLREYTLTAVQADGSCDEGVFLKCLRRGDLVGADFGAEALRLQGLAANHPPRAVLRLDYVCLIDLLGEIGAFGQLVLVGLGVPAVVSAGFTFKGWLDHVAAHAKLARGLPTLKAQVEFLINTHQNMQEGLRIMGATLRATLGVGRPHLHTLGALLPADAKPVTNLAERATVLERMREITHFHPDFGRMEGAAPAFAHNLPLLSTHSDGFTFASAPRGKGGKGQGGKDGQGGKGGRGGEGRARGKRPLEPSSGGVGGAPGAIHGAAPGSLMHTFILLSPTTLLTKSAVWDLTKLAKACGTTVAAKEWPLVVSRMMPHNKPGLCARFGEPGAHRDHNSSAHACPTFDYTSMLETCSRRPTQQEVERLTKQMVAVGGAAGSRGKGRSPSSKGRGRGRPRAELTVLGGSHERHASGGAGAGSDLTALDEASGGDAPSRG